MSQIFAMLGASRWSLRRRIAWLWWISALLLVALAGGIFQREAGAVLREQASQALEQQVDAVARDLDDRISQRRRLLSLAARQMVVDADELPAEAPHLAQRYSHLNALFDTLVFVDVSGRIVGDIPSVAGRVGQNIQFREYFQRTLRTLRPQVSEPLRARGEGPPKLVLFTAPLKDEDGRFSGMLLGSIDLISSDFVGDLKRFRLNDSGYLTISAVRSRLTLFHPDPSRVLKPVPLPDENPLLQRALAGWEGVEEGPWGRDGEMALYAYRHLKNANWVVGAVVPTRAAELPIASLAREAWSFVLVAAVLLIGTTLFALSRMLRPLQRLRERAVARHDGHLAGPISVEGAEELQELATIVSTLAAERDDARRTLIGQTGFFETLNEVSPLGVLVVEASGEIGECNPAADHLLAREGEAVVGSVWLDHVLPAQRDELSALWRAAVTLDAPLRCQSVLEKAGRPAVVWRFQRLPGEARRYLAALLEVSGEVHAAQALGSERERMLAVLATIREAVVLTNARGEIEYLNPPALGLLDKRPTALAGQPFTRVTHFVDAATGHPVDIGTLSIESGARAVDLVRDDGSRFAVEVTVARVGGAHGFEDGRVVVMQDDAMRREHEVRHRWETLHDPLTRLYNRRGFHQALSALLADELRRESDHAVAMLDLDHFKAVNDRRGPLLGDALLQEVAGLIAQSLRVSDVVARFGGDRFMVLLYDCPPEVAERLLSELLAALGQYRFEGPDGRLHHIGASIGYTRIERDDQIPGDSMARAETRCRVAKQGGRNRLVMRDA